MPEKAIGQENGQANGDAEDAKPRNQARCSGVGSAWIDCNDAPIWPNFVAIPVAVVRIVASPATTSVPANTSWLESS